MSSHNRLKARALPPFEPRVQQVQCANGPTMPALAWAFSSCVPPVARFAFAGPGGADNASLRNNATPEMMWNYSLFHLASHYATMSGRLTKFIVTNEEDTAAILIEVTAVRECPEGVEGLNALPRSEFFDPGSGREPLGALPIFFVRYFHEEKGSHPSWQPSNQATNFIRGAQHEGGLMKILAASVEEINFAHKELVRGQSLLGKETKTGKFNESVLFPVKITKTKGSEKAPYVCAACDKVVSGKKYCSACKITYYCGRECQVAHWKTGGHKDACLGGKRGAGSGPRKSFVFDIEDAKAPANYMTSFNHQTGSVNVAGADKKARSEMKKSGINVSKMPTARNNYGDREFIVKLQPPAGPMSPTGAWMCYDGPTRSFQAYIPAYTAGLPEVYNLLQRDGIKASNPMFGVVGYKGYFKAKWEGSSLRVFYDKVVPSPGW